MRGNQGGGHQRDRTCECERDQITLTLSGGSSDGALRGAIRGNQEAIHETHLRGVTIEFNQEAINDPERHSGHQSSSILEQTQSDAISHLERCRERDKLAEGEGGLGFVPDALGRHGGMGHGSGESPDGELR